MGPPGAPRGPGLLRGLFWKLVVPERDLPGPLQLPEGRLVAVVVPEEHLARLGMLDGPDHDPGDPDVPGLVFGHDEDVAPGMPLVEDPVDEARFGHPWDSTRTTARLPASGRVSGTSPASGPLPGRCRRCRKRRRTPGSRSPSDG